MERKTDIRKRALEIAEPETERDKLPGLYNFAPLSYLSLNTRGNIINMNLKCAEMFGIERNFLNNQSIFHLIAPEYQDIYYHLSKKIDNTQEPQSCELQMVRRDKTSFYAHLICEPVRDKKGVVIEFRIAIIDISELKYAQEESHKKQKIESLGVLAGGIAHDFNNLLGGLFGYLEIAQEFTKDTKAEKYLDKAMMCFEHTKELTHKLITFAKGGLPLKKTVSVERIIREASKITLSGSKCDCTYDIVEDLYLCDADPGQINQVVTNIFLNARQAMPEGGLIDVKAVNVDLSEPQMERMSQGKYIMITVTDRGVGIPEHLRDKVFDPYFSTKQTGCGLGLATSQSIIKNHKGSINIRSRVEAGTTVTVFLPASESPVITEEKGSTENLSGTGKILIMDDELAIREVAKQMLSNLGYEVEVAEKGETALEKYNTALRGTGKFDLVLLDLTIIGGMDGETTMRKILEIDPNAKGIVSSGYSDNCVLANPKEYGFCSSINKPFRKKELGLLVQKVLKEL